MQRRLLDILACPIDKHYPLDLLEFEVKGDVIVEGMLTCSECGRYYPIIDEIPVMLPDNLRNKKEDLGFLERWGTKLPDKIVHGGKPWSLNGLPTEETLKPSVLRGNLYGGVAQPGRATGSSANQLM